MTSARSRRMRKAFIIGLFIGGIGLANRLIKGRRPVPSDAVRRPGRTNHRGAHTSGHLRLFGLALDSTAKEPS